MSDNFNIHNWQLARQIAEYRHVLEPVPGPISEEEVMFVWNQLRNNTSVRANIIASAAPGANVNSKAFDWNDVNATLKGLIVGYMNKYSFKTFFRLPVVKSIVCRHE